LIQNKNEKIRKSIDQTFRVLCNHVEQQKLESPKLFILKALIKNLPIIQKHSIVENEFYEEYFGLISQLIKLCQPHFFIDEKANRENLFD
jgi:hypothetical protein